MKAERNNFYIITGGPGSGKTTIINTLKQRGFLIVDEVARQIIQEQVKMNGEALHWKDQIKFRDLMLSRSVSAFERIAETEKPVFFDRGIPELIGYCHLIKTTIPDYLAEAVDLYRYNQKIFVTPPWREIYQHDVERKQTWQEAVATYHHIVAAYLESGYQAIEIPTLSVAERVDFILAQINQVD